MARDYPGRAEWEDEMKAALRIPTWEIFDKSDGVVCPAGLLLSLGDGSAVAITGDVLNFAMMEHSIPSEYRDRVRSMFDYLLKQAQEHGDV